MLNRLSYTTTGTCSRQTDIETDGDLIRRVTVTGGCHGHTPGIAAPVPGMKVEEATARPEGLALTRSGASYPHRASRALRSML